VGEHNGLKYGAVLTRGIERLTGLDDHEQGTTRLSETLYPVLDMWSRPDFSYPRGELLWAIGGVTQTAVAAQFQQVGIRNPPGSGAIVVVDSAAVKSTVAQDYTLRLALNSVVGGVGSPVPRDMRQPNAVSGLGNATITQSIINSAAARLGILISQLNGTGQTELDFKNCLPVVLMPGFDLFLGPEIVNQIIIANFRGYERLAFKGEIGA
jgi:hypothetical protein